MSGAVLAVPAGPFFRIGRYPDPLAWPPPEYSGMNRFDDPAGRFQVLYAGEQRLACFVETLAPLRPDVRTIALARSLPADPDAAEEAPAGTVPSAWLAARRIGAFSLRAGQQWLDLRAFSTREALRANLAARWAELALEDFDLGDAVTRRRAVSQAIAGWAYKHGYQGIAYPSRFDAGLSCWALFSGARIVPLANDRIAADDHDLLAALRLLNLRLGWVGYAPGGRRLRLPSQKASMWSSRPRQKGTVAISPPGPISRASCRCR
ncbi:MAG TPA: RES family NAD+ phosphorylase [Dehalococcoidia bacterium]|nr:RES family NAD+ phosphorylase [Dehalococcoidia bacterium]